MRNRKLCKHKATGLYYVTIKGKPKYLGRNKAEAKTEMNRLVREAARNGDAPSTDLTFGELIQDYSHWFEANRAASAWEAKRHFFDNLQASKLASRNALAIRPVDIESWLAARPKIKSPTTKFIYISALSRMYAWAMEFGLLPKNPLAKMPKPAPRIRQDFLPAGRFPELLAAAPSDAARDFIMVMLESGARAMEMFKLTADHFHKDRFVFDIASSKGGKRSRVIFLPDRAKAIVERLVEQYPTGALFNNTKGTPWDRHSMGFVMRQIRTKLGLKALPITALRHSYAHYLLTVLKVSAADVAKLMGHRDVGMVYKVYGHLDGSDYLAEKAAAIEMPLELPEKKTG